MNTKEMKSQPQLAKVDKLITQYQHENETGKRVLEFLKEENLHLINRVSDILQIMDDGNEFFLERIEYFQNCFVIEDKIIGYLHAEISEQDKLLVRDFYEEDEHLMKELKNKQKKLRVELESVEKEFNKMKSEFNTYLSEVL